MARPKSFFHVRKSSLKGRIAARTSIKRMIRTKTRAPRGWGWLTNPKKASYNRLYTRRTVSIGRLSRRCSAADGDAHPHDRSRGSKSAARNRPAALPELRRHRDAVHNGNCPLYLVICRGGRFNLPARSVTEK